MTQPATQSAPNPAPVLAYRSKTDPILLELWEIKRQINEEAHFDIAELARRANAFDLDLAMKQLGVSLNPVIKDEQPLAGTDKRPDTKGG